MISARTRIVLTRSSDGWDDLHDTVQSSTIAQLSKFAADGWRIEEVTIGAEDAAGA